jgi:sulfite reductase (NADPH) flavoprotein alpha-component
MGLAFSRDQKEKIYIQHKMKEDADILADYLLNQKGHFYLCGPTWPVPDVKDAVVHGLVKFGGVDAAKASALIEEWKEKETYILEVY